MANTNYQVKLSDHINDIYKGNYSDIKEELHEIFLKIGIQKLNWKLRDSNNQEIVFETKMTFRSLGEQVTVNYFSDTITIKSLSKQKGVFTTWGKNDENCKKYLKLIVPKVREYLKNKETLRSKNNKAILNEVNKKLNPLEYNESFSNIIKENQSKFDRHLIPNLLKIISYYKNQIDTYSMFYKNIKNPTFHNSRTNKFENTIFAVETYYKSIKLIEIGIENMLQKYLENEIIDFYKIYNSFEELGIFITKGERLIINNLNDLNNNMNEVINSIHVMIDKTEDLSKDILEVNKTLEVQNFISAISVYQQYRINKKLK